MNRLRLLLIAAAGIGLVFVVIVSLAGDEPITLDAPTRIHAGDAWAATLFVEAAEAGESASVTLMNGLQTLEANLTLGTGGIARWDVPAGKLTQAGMSVVVVRYGEGNGLKEWRQTLEVLPLEPVTADLFTTANGLPAYGQGSTTVLVLPRDAWGNAPLPDYRLRLEVQYPAGNRITYPFNYAGGPGYFQYISRGGPGRVRFLLDQGALSAVTELQQMPGVPHQVTLQINPDCVPDTGREALSLLATVADEHDYPVTDGTLVRFSWSGGIGYGYTVDGEARLRLPAPATPGVRLYRAAAGEVQSSQAILRVTAESCPDER